MRAMSQCLWTAILGGILFLTPIVVLALVLSKAFDFARRGLKPIATMIPAQLASRAATEAIVAIVFIVLLCFACASQCEQQ
ncbi:MAG: hypothetical protein JO288_22110 [Hyphomicrobiales bacterium]|nr:hypothetical protein [Hyphomicrobiales bacterium]